MDISSLIPSQVLTEAGKVLGFISAGIVGYFVPKVSQLVKNKLQQKYFNISLKKSIEIKLKLAEVKAALGAKRIYMFQFHNGTVYLGDHNFHKYSMSAIFEVVSQGLSREIQNLQSKPLSNYVELLSFLMESDHEHIIVGNHRGSDMDFNEADLEDMLYSMKPETIIFFKVYNNKKQFIGLICMCFDAEVTKAKLMEMKESSDLNSLLIDIRNKI